MKILYDGCESNLTVDEFLDPVGIFPQLVEDGVESVNLTRYLTVDEFLDVMGGFQQLVDDSITVVNPTPYLTTKEFLDVVGLSPQVEDSVTVANLTRYLTVDEFLDVMGTFQQLVRDGVTTVNLTIYRWNLNHQWFDSNGGDWLDLIREHQDKRCFIVSDLQGTFNYGLVWDTL